jgi:hypothetical protein
MSKLSISNIGSLGTFKNKIINGNFDIWQRGTSHSTLGYGSVDRWFLGVYTSTCTLTRTAFTLGQTDVPNEPTYYVNCDITEDSAAGSCAFLQHKIEDVRTFTGKTVTLSFYAKSADTLNLTTEVFQWFGSGGSAYVNGIGVNKVSLTTSWQKFTVTMDIPSISGKTLDTAHCLNVMFWLDAGSTYNVRTDSLGHQTGVIDIAQVQLEEGSFPTNFEMRHIGQELALCQRYYYRITDGYIGVGAGVNSSVVRMGWQHPVAMRTTPTFTASGNARFNINASHEGTFGVMNQDSYLGGMMQWTSFSGFTPSINEAYAIDLGLAGVQYITFDAEL